MFRRVRADSARVKPGGHLPSIVTLLTFIGALVLIPLVGIGTAQWRDAETRYDGAIHVQETAAKLDVLLRLAPAIDTESLSTGWSAGGNTFGADLPVPVAQLLGFDFAASVETDREAVDQLLAEVNNADLSAALLDVRQSADSGDLDIFQIGTAYGGVLADVETLITAELTNLDTAATVAGDPNVARAATIAEMSADVRVAAIGLDMQWAKLSSAEFLEPSLAEVEAFNYSIALFLANAAALDAAIPNEGPMRDEWTAIETSDSLQLVQTRYKETVDQLAISGVAAEPDSSRELDISMLSITDMFALASALTETLEASDDADAAIANLVDLALADLEQASASAVSGAEADRSNTLGWLFAAAVFVIGGILGLVLLISVPVRRMADAARKLSKGELDVRLAERGPTEVRVGSRAINQALASLQIAEAQAVALAEERLDDPILEREAPGDLGKSLQAAVRRLAVSLTERDSFQRRLAHEAAHDGLTKISNRNAILHHLESALARTRRSKSTLALLFLDIDDFKKINDLHGHEAGDVLLQTIAQRIMATIREGDLAGRLGGDEFVVVAEPVADLDTAVGLAERIIEACAKPFTYDGVTLAPGVSIGVGLADGSLTADEVLRDADLAVYRAKSLGKGRVDVCDEELRTHVRERASLETAIRDAIEADEFVLHYQPSVKVGSHAVTSIEALVRWQNPTGGMIFPDAFIPTAERGDLIIDIDCWVLDAVAAQLAEWKDDPVMSGIPVAVNISGRHLGSGMLLKHVENILRTHDLPGELLILEVTETALLDDLHIAARDLALIRDLGVSVALDDFGTGFMSLAHLRTLPMDVLKIDRSFVWQIDSSADHSLVQLIIDTGHVLGLTVTAEGVETTMQIDQLSTMGVDTLQGYYFGRPVSARAVRTALSTTSTRAAA